MYVSVALNPFKTSVINLGEFKTFSRPSKYKIRNKTFQDSAGTMTGAKAHESHQVQCVHEAKLTTPLPSGTMCTRGKTHHLTPIRYSVHTRQNSSPHSYQVQCAHEAKLTTSLLSHPTPIRYSVHTRQNSPPHSYQVQCAHEAKLTTSLLSGTVCTQGKTHHPTPITPHSYQV